MAQAGNIVANLQLKIGNFRDGIQEAQRELGNFSNTTSNIAKGAAVAFAAVGTAVAGVAAAGVKMATEFEDASAKMQAATGSTTAEMNEFKDAADNMFGNARGSYEEIFGALTTVKQQLGQTGKEAEKTADMALSMSKAFGWDVNESIRAVSATQKAWGATSEQSFDMFAALTQQAGDKADDLLDTFNEYSPTLAEVGWSMEDVGNAMARGMQNGAYNYDVMADALKEFKVLTTDGNENTKEWAATLLGGKAEADKFFAGLADGSLSGSDAVGLITEKLGAMDDKNLQMQAGVALFGTKWEDASAETILAMGGVEGGLTNVEGAAANAANVMDNTLGHKVEKIKNSFLLWAKDLGEQFIPILKQFADWVIANMPAIQSTMTTVFTAIGAVVTTVAQILGSVIGFVIQNADAFKALAAVVTAVVLPAMLGFIAQATVMKAKALGGLIVSTAKMIAANYALGLSFLAANAPMIAIAAGIIALIAVIVLIVKHWDKVKEVTFAVWEAIKTFLAATWEWLKATFQSLGTWLSTTWSTIWNGIKTFFVTIWNGIKAVATSIWNGLKVAFMAVFDAIKLYFQTVLNVYKTIFTTIWNAIKTAAIAIWNALKSSATSIFNAIKNTIQSVMNSIKSLITSIWNSIKSFIVSTFNSIKSSATSVWNAIKNAISTAVNAIRSTITSVFNAVRSTVTNVWNSIRSSISGAMSGIRSTVSNGANFMRNTFTSAVNKVKSVFSGMWSSIRGSLDNVVSGIKSKVTAAKEWLGELNPFKRHSPSLVDNVLAGTKVIKDTYEGLGGLQIAPPQIGSLTAGRMDVEDAFGGMDEGSGGGGSTYNAPIVQVENMHVRDDNDVRNVSRELFGLQRSHDRAKGGR